MALLRNEYEVGWQELVDAKNNLKVSYPLYLNIEGATNLEAIFLNQSIWKIFVPIMYLELILVLHQFFRESFYQGSHLF